VSSNKGGKDEENGVNSMSVVGLSEWCGKLLVATYMSSRLSANTRAVEAGRGGKGTRGAKKGALMVDECSR